MSHEVDEHLGVYLPTFHGDIRRPTVRYRGEEWWLGSPIMDAYAPPNPYSADLLQVRFELIPIPPWARERHDDIPDNIVLGEN